MSAVTSRWVYKVLFCGRSTNTDTRKLRRSAKSEAISERRPSTTGNTEVLQSYYPHSLQTHLFVFLLASSLLMTMLSLQILSEGLSVSICQNISEARNAGLRILQYTAKHVNHLVITERWQPPCIEGRT